MNKKTRMTFIIIAIVIVSLIVLNIVSLVKFSSKVDITSEPTIQIPPYESSVTNEELLQEIKKQGSIVSHYDATWNEQLNKDKQITITLEATPKTETKGQVVSFFYKIDENKQQEIKAEKDGYTYRANVTAPLFNSMKYGVVIRTGDKKQIEALNEVTDVKTSFIHEIQSNGFIGSINTGNVLDGHVSIDIPTMMDEADFKKMDLNLIKNGEIVWTKSMKYAHADGISYGLPLKKEKIEAEKGDSVQFMVIGEDKNGFNYSLIVSDWTIGKDGFLEDVPNTNHEVIVE